MKNKITGDDCVRCLKTMRANSFAGDIAFLLKTDSRAVATALRKPVKDGRVWIGNFNGVATYTFLRSTAAKVKGGSA